MTLPPGTFMTTTVNGLVTPLSYPYSGEEPIPQDELSSLDDAHPYAQFDLNSQYAYLNEFSAGHTPTWEPYGPQQMGSSRPSISFGHDSYYQNGSSFVTTAPPTPDFLPIQHFSSRHQDSELNSYALRSKPSGDELVGMGLYDAPEALDLGDGALWGKTYLESFDGTEPSPVGGGKGLKLEETFQPSMEAADENLSEDEEEEPENGDGTEEQAGLAATARTFNGEMHTIDPRFPQPEQRHAYTPPVTSLTTDLSNHSFFFEHEGEHRPQLSHTTDFSGDIWTSGISSAPYGWI